MMLQIYKDSSEIIRKSKEFGAQFAADCLLCYEGNKDAQKRFFEFLIDNFPKTFKHKQIKKCLSSLDTHAVDELNQRLACNDIYNSLKKLKTVLGGNND